LRGEHEDGRPLEKLGRRQEDNTKADIREMGTETVDWSHITLCRSQLWAPVNMEKTFGIHNMLVTF
jgi:hypothetical protein